MKHSYTKEQFEAAVSSSSSIRQALTILGIPNQGGSYNVFHKYVKQFDICTKHFTGAAWAKGRTFAPKENLSVYLSNTKPIGSHRLRQRLISEGVMQAVCSNCQNNEWLCQPIPLELDHINGNCSDNQLLNLRLLCPNCHALTPTYRGKNQARKKK